MVVLLTKNKTAIIDPESFSAISKFTWHFDGRYAATCICVGRKKKKKYLHQFLIGAKPGLVIDHINRNRLDNRRVNLRLISRSKNALNTSRAGAHFIKSGKRIKRWMARIMVQGKVKHLGYFLTKNEAREAYEKELAGHIL